jgi:hypothetical protein
METRRCIPIGLFLAACLSVLACTGVFRNYGRFNPSDDVNQAFANYQVNKDFRYYISGSDLYPNAIMGLSRSYRLDPRTLWREVPMTTEKMKEIVQYMSSRDSTRPLEGFELLDDNDRPIGVWYSLVEAKTFLRIQEDGTVRIDTPPLAIHKSQVSSLMVVSVH